MPTLEPTIQITREIDARGSFCPGPLMELIRAVKAAQVGDVIAVLSGDDGSVTDIPAWVAKAGQDFLGIEAAEGARRFTVRKVK
ncbi:MAG TPA: sulfurtransferase TusA family protein [Deinococcales bacterium]|nr:sulfurtransferase TusA family protein [Deinococcales bacterium]